MSAKPPLEPDYTLDEVADALGMSTRWVRDQIRAGEQGTGPHVEHIRRGHKIRFTKEQVEKLRAFGVRAVINEPVTTGPSKKRSA